MKELTPRQQEIFNYINDNMVYVPPTFRDIARHFNMTVKGAYDHVKAIEKKGHKFNPRMRRAGGQVIVKVKP